ncbi:hypothetical protein Bbelb_203590 [Branchiostoma belcheri]|nr:hypothetical protein Bbelb_203590 [Branchiostoma belcheri]
MKRSGLLLCTFGLNRVLQFLFLTSVCWTYQDSRVEATTCDCAADCVSYCTAGWALAKYYWAEVRGGWRVGKPSRGVYCVSNCTLGLLYCAGRGLFCCVSNCTAQGRGREGVVVQG